MANIILYHLHQDEQDELVSGAEEIGLRVLTTTTETHGNMLCVPNITNEYQKRLPIRLTRTATPRLPRTMVPMFSTCRSASIMQWNECPCCGKTTTNFDERGSAEPCDGCFAELARQDRERPDSSSRIARLTQWLSKKVAK